nr:PQQ-binding-like beta-propeller repeat protein [Candidatus Sigynarchaeota archaeon]
MNRNSMIIAVGFTILTSLLSTGSRPTASAAPPAAQFGMIGVNGVGDVQWTKDTGFYYLSSPVAGDIDGNGKIEIVTAGVDDMYAENDSCHVVCIHGINGSLKWIKPVIGYIIGNPVLVSMNTTDEMDVIIATSRNDVYCLHGTNGTQVWTYTASGDIEQAPVAGDIDGDGVDEVIFGVIGVPYRILCLDGRTGAVDWSGSVSDSITSSCSIVDMNSDGVPDVIVGLTSGVACFSGNNGSTIATILSLPGVKGDSAVGDVDRDDHLEIVAVSMQHVYCLDVTTRVVEWTYDSGTYWYSSVAILDCDNDGRREVLIELGGLSRMVCIDGMTGALEWQNDDVGGYSPGFTACDVNDDMEFEILVNTYDEIDFLHGTNGTFYQAFTGSESLEMPLVADVDDDGMVEIIACSTIGRVYCLLATGPSWALPGPWPCTRGSPARAACYVDADHDAMPDDLERALSLNATNNDSDGDSLNDYWEITFGTNPLIFTSNTDLDGDGLDMLAEQVHGSNPRRQDTDADGLADGAEITDYGTDPINPDTDGDGYPDGNEVALGTNPLDRNDSPLTRGLIIVAIGGVIAVVVVVLVIGGRKRVVSGFVKVMDQQMSKLNKSFVKGDLETALNTKRSIDAFIKRQLATKGMFLVPDKDARYIKGQYSNLVHYHVHDRLDAIKDRLRGWQDSINKKDLDGALHSLGSMRQELDVLKQLGGEVDYLESRIAKEIAYIKELKDQRP